METKTLIEYGKSIVIILIVVIAGLYAVNLFLDYNYKSQLLQQPCALCLSLNPDADLCPKKVTDPMQVYYNMLQSNSTI